MRRLVIVESPPKAKKISSLLGPGYLVKASVGHIRDLPLKEMGISPDNLSPQYEISPDKKKVVADLRNAVQSASEVILATDPDREGEAISWHLKDVLRLSKYQRVTFTEITKEALTKAFSSPRQIDMDKVAAQECRRVLDRIIGYTVSPALSKQAGKPLSAGRVQSVALLLVVMREREIKSFTQQTYYSVEILLPNGVKAELDPKPWAEDQKHIWDRAIADQIAQTKQVVLMHAESKTVTVKPRPPFITSTLQQAASTVLGFSPSKTMQCAQKLFEQGLITYLRTDYPNLSEEGFEKIKSYLESKGIPAAASNHKWEAKESAQEAHEAIRPTHIEDETGGSSDDERKLYALIRERALCAAMPQGEDLATILVFVSTQAFTNLKGQPQPAHFTVAGKVVKEPGWRKYANIEGASDKDKPIPAMQVNQTYQCEAKTAEKKTKPPERYTEATLIKKLEQEGVGRPSTYASILSNITQRMYIVIGDPAGRKKKSKDMKIYPTSDGEYVVDSLVGMQFMSVGYTKAVETALDSVAAGKMKYINIVRPVYETVHQDIKKHLTGGSLVKTGSCPKCQKTVKQLTKNRKTFWVHTEETQDCEKYLADERGSPIIKPKQEAITASCPKCAKEVKQLCKDGRYFWVHCDDNHGCERFLSDDNGTPIIKPKKEIITASCPKCTNQVKRLYSSKTSNHFWVHVNDKHAKKCAKFIDDEDGKPAHKS